MAAFPYRAVLVAATLALVLGGCGATDSDGAAGAAERLYAAYADQDGETACAQFSDDTREQLEKDERKPCPEAVLALDLSGTRVTGEQAYVTEAKVEIDGGDSVFVEETGEHGWLVTAAGCRPVPDQEAPYDCEVES
ncbi:MAG TPA: hypothetical protein VHF90_06055 [Thermoleophilaceae bacterium]|jgi:hypothetical protein|nr:hypothetical protein [Thermoleophilaceae bacterium]